MPATASANAEASTPASNDPAKPAAGRIDPGAEAHAAADQGRRYPEAQRPRRRLHQPQGKADLRAARLRAAVRHAGGDRAARPGRWARTFSPRSSSRTKAPACAGTLSMPPELPRAAKPSPEASQGRQEGRQTAAEAGDRGQAAASDHAGSGARTHQDPAGGARPHRRDPGPERVAGDLRLRARFAKPAATPISSCSRARDHGPQRLRPVPAVVRLGPIG